MFSTLHSQSDYWQVDMSPKDRENTVSLTRRGYGSSLERLLASEMAVLPFKEQLKSPHQA